MKKIFYFLTFVALILLSATNLSAQLNQGGSPVGLELEKQERIDPVEFEVMPEFDLEALREEDETLDGKPGVPFRFGQNLYVNLNLQNSGSWNFLDDGSRLWRLGVTSKGAKTINLLFSEYRLPKGAKLFVYSPDGREVLGAFNHLNNQDDGQFATTLLRADAVIIEYHEPANPEFPGKLNLSRVTHGYRGVGDMMDKGFGDSGSCNLNVACTEADDWQQQVRTVAMLVTGGNGFCTGALINNAENDGTPYFLSANHCYSDPGSVVYWFNWQSETCSNPASSPTHDALSGAVDRARHEASDFWLVELNDTPPEDYDVYYAGWNRTIDDLAEIVIGVHHPSGDIKKFSYANEGVQAASYLGDAGTGTTHWRIVWSGGTTTEPGSSGSPIFDSEGRLLGQLHGGSAACGNTEPDWYGRFGISWDGGGTSATRLSDWLDPSGTDVDAIYGFDPILDAADPDAPAAVELFTATSGDLGALTAELEWTNPTETFDGVELTELTGINIYRDGNLIHTVASPTIGGSESYTDNDISEAGNYTYVVKPENSAGEGPQVVANIYVGEDKPGEVGNITLVDQNNNGYLTWEAPTTGMNDGYYDPTSLIEYQITRHPDEATFTVDAADTELLDETLPGIGYYSYTITPVNDIGQGQSATSETVLLASEGAVFMGDGSVTSCEGTFFDSGGPEGDYGNDENFTLTFYPETEGAKMRFQFTSYNTESGYDYLSVYNGTGTDAADLIGTFDGEGVPEELVDFTSTHSTGAVTFNFTSDGSAIRAGWEASFSCFIPSENDLRAATLSGNFTPTLGVETAYNLNVLNIGSENQLGADYTVELKNSADDLVLATANGVDVNVDETVTIEIPWTPSDEGEMSVYAFVNFANDANPDDNSSNSIDLNVQPEGTTVVTVGDGNEELNIPYDMYYHHSLSQTIYYSDELIVTDGVINAIQYQNTFDESYNDRSIQIWMGETDLLNLAEGWVDPSTLQLVFDGTVDFPAGENDIFIQLDVPFEYNGGNLVVYSHKADVDWSGSKKFKGTEYAGSSRTLKAERDNDPYNPTSPDEEGTIQHFAPNTVFFFANMHEVNFSVEGGNGSLLASVNGTEIQSGDFVNANSDVVFNATPNEGYKVKQWTVNGDILESLTGNEYTHDNLQEAITVSVEFETVTNITSESFSNLNVYPNPFSEHITISNAEYIDKVVITNLVGQQVMDIKLNGETEINTNELSEGVYLVTFVANNGEKLVKKMIKQ